MSSGSVTGSRFCMSLPWVMAHPNRSPEAGNAPESAAKTHTSLCHILEDAPPTRSGASKCARRNTARTSRLALKIFDQRSRRRGVPF